MSTPDERPIYIMMISMHGLIRAENLELGRDADTGGQITYVVELARALGKHPMVEKVDLITRRIEDENVSKDYSVPEEQLEQNARIIRLPCGPRRYLRKESLWPHLDQMVDQCLHFLRSQGGRLPDLLHTHYADAGYVGRQLSLLLGIPQVHTGHSLGHPKRQRLLAAGRKASSIERQFNFERRIAAEESILEHASMIVTSTQQEIDEQYSMYRHFDYQRFRVIPPGTDTTRFSPPGRRKISSELQAQIDRFFSNPDKPLILTICRPEVRKNLKGLIAAFGESTELQQQANLLIVAGARDDIRQLEESQQQVMLELLLDIDRYDLWGKVAIPKHVSQDNIPELYRLAARRRGVFVNAALTEPFGLTLIEAAASGLPFVAPDDGGPRDIVQNCRSGLLANTLDSNAIASALLDLLSDKKRWRTWAKNGLAGIRRHYNWPAHVNTYMKQVSQVLRRDRKRWRRQLVITLDSGKSYMPLVNSALISDIDNTLLGDKRSLRQLVHWLKERKGKFAFGIATGRTIESAVNILRQWQVPIPEVLITSVGSEIHYGARLIPDTGWANHIRHKWRRDALEEAMKYFPGLTLQAEENQREFKLSYIVDPDKMPPLEEINLHLRSQQLFAQLIYSHNEFLDLLPIRASKGHAIRYLAYKWGVPVRHFLVAGDSGNDHEMLVGDTLGVVVGNHSQELEQLRGMEQVYFAKGHYAAGILEGIAHYRFDEIEPSPVSEH
ncbi:HAD-IIB family hydrolase [Methylobacillus flagellatus]|uniref:sucrose-phosphate synthase n=1 Tax=Methylobacillus flagellatus (strain ATCC 51484 / DSM 6875 / VKM B-1610 / KT) TaxID=265072 RepID=Q1GY13_METFK|nr:HAD-IIB family hydrolase [Methylobacillus flagellatus]ABE50874.1 Sucrose-phosphate synthase, glycosyltransferase region [Methylobacillus flagellatus KT]